MEPLEMGSLFAGIGGFELSATWAGIKPIWSNEIDPWCCKVLRKNFDHEIIESDIRQISADTTKQRFQNGRIKEVGESEKIKESKRLCSKIYLPKVDILTGGFPCQPFSHAGKRKGKDDNRYLWPEYLRLIRELQPSWIIAENVAGLISMENGKTLERILDDLENENYQTEIYNIPACGVGAWHKRERIWIVCHSEHNGSYGYAKQRGNEKDDSKWCKEKQDKTRKSTRAGKPGNEGSGKSSKGRSQSGETNNAQDVSNSHYKRLQGSEKKRDIDGGWKERKQFTPRHSRTGRTIWDSEPRMGGMVARISSRMDRNINDLFFISHLCIFAYVKIYMNGTNTKGNGIEILRSLRSGISENEIQWQIRGFDGVQEKEILLTHLCKLQESEFEQKWLSLEGQKISKEELLILWNEQEPSGTPHKSESQKQPSGKFTDALQTLSRLLAFYSKEIENRDSRGNAISGYWDKEPNIPRVATGIKGRVDRLKGLGNAIVPQVAYEIFKAIVNQIDIFENN